MRYSNKMQIFILLNKSNKTIQYGMAKSAEEYYFKNDLKDCVIPFYADKPRNLLSNYPEFRYLQKGLSHHVSYVEQVNGKIQLNTKLLSRLSILFDKDYDDVEDHFLTYGTSRPAIGYLDEQTLF